MGTGTADDDSFAAASRTRLLREAEYVEIQKVHFGQASRVTESECLVGSSGNCEPRLNPDETP